jgi:fructose-1,6-bisphosphatase/sedoheptulose 1,7-bisphosphatase-like protein
MQKMVSGPQMTITVDIKPDVQAELARQAAAHGMGIDAYAATLLEEAAHVSSGADKQRAHAAAARIRALREGVTLGGRTIKELIDEGRR